MLLPQAYDDGGISGGHLDRPGVQQLLADVDAGLVDQIVVYKVDRLTRSLTDFSKLVERLDAAGASFVSVTQSFNTATSMGRLTLNMLLSFAQFEREVTAERIRDKIASSKAKGMWMGGTVPFGYDKDGRTLKIRQDEAKTVRLLFNLYAEGMTVPALADYCAEKGIINRKIEKKDGAVRGGNPFRPGPLYWLLNNPIYAGKIAHKGKTYDGQHPAIIDQGLWDKVQARLAKNNQGPRQRGQITKARLPLLGLLKDDQGRPFKASHSRKGTRRFDYYLQNKRAIRTEVNRIANNKDCLPTPASPPPLRYGARMLEETIGQAVVAHLNIHLVGTESAD